MDNTGPKKRESQLRHLVAPKIFLVGASGSGKTVVARKLSGSIGWRAYDTDAIILERSGGHNIGDIFDNFGEAYFRQLEIGILDELISHNEKKIVATGGGLPATPGTMQRLNSVGGTIYLRASVDTLWKRVMLDPKELNNRPLLRNGKRTALAELVKKRSEFYQEATIVLDTDAIQVPAVCEIIMSYLHIH